MRAILAVVITLLLILMATGTQFVDSASANATPYQSLTIDLPKSQTYNTSSVQLSVIVRVPNELPEGPNDTNVTSIAWMKYSLDGNANVSITEFQRVLAWDIVGSVGFMITANTYISGLSNGEHFLTVYAQKTNGEVSSDFIDFTVDAEDTADTEDTSPPIEWVITAMVAVAVVGVGLVFFLFKRKKRLTLAGAE